MGGSCHVTAAWFLAGAYKDSERRHEVNEIKNENKYEMMKKDMEVAKKDMEVVAKKDMEVAAWKAEANFMASKVRAGRMCDCAFLSLMEVQLMIDIFYHHGCRLSPTLP